MRIYQREGSPYWWVDASVRGRRLRRSTGETSRRAAELAAHRLIAGAQERVQPPATQWRLRQVIGVYWEDKGKHLASEDAVFRYFARAMEVLGRDTPVMDITERELVEFAAAVRGGAKRTTSMVTINRHFSMLRAAMRYAARVYKAQVPNIDWSSIRVAENEPRVRYASQPDLAALLDAADVRIRPIIIAAVATGLRKANILDLRWRQVDMNGRTLTIPRTKGKKPIVLRIAAPLLAVLSAVKGKRQPDKRVFDTRNFRRLWDAARKGAGIEDFHFHDLRHTFATHALMNGASLAELQRALAHSDIKTTMRYAHIEAQAVEGVFDRAASALPAPNMAQNLAQ